MVKAGAEKFQEKHRWVVYSIVRGFPGGAGVKNLPANAGEARVLL